MSFSVVSILLLFIGSSVAQVDIFWVTGLQKLHTLTNGYITMVVVTYTDYQNFMLTQPNLAFTQVGVLLGQEYHKQLHNLQYLNVPGAELYPISTREHLLRLYTSTVTNAIDAALAMRPDNLSDEIAADKNETILRATRTLMQKINDDPQIFDDLKGSQCPIFAKLRSITNTYGGRAAAVQFNQDFQQA